MNKRVLFYANEMDGCTYYRTIVPHRFLSHFWRGVSLSPKLPTVENLGHTSDFLNYDTFVFQRLMLPQFHETIFPFLKRSRKRIIYDIDDLLWQIPDYNNAFCFYGTKIIEDLTNNIRQSNAVVVSTPPLAEFVKSFNRNVIVIPNHLETCFPYRDKFNEKVKVGWCGSPSHFGDFSESLINYLDKLIAEDKIEFTVFGDAPPFCEKNDKVRKIGWCDISRYQTTLNKLNLDIGLIVCKDNLFNDCKSNIKYLEYSSASICSIADDVHPYRTTITDGENGFLVKKPSDWKKHLDFLINNPDERKRITKSANQLVATNYTLTGNANNYYSLWESII